MPKPDELSFSVKKSLVAGSIVGAATVTGGCFAPVNSGAPARDDVGPGVQEDATDAGSADGASDTDEGETEEDATSDAEGDSFDPSNCPDGAICNPVPDGVGGGEEDADSGTSGTADADAERTDT